MKQTKQTAVAMVQKPLCDVQPRGEWDSTEIEVVVTRLAGELKHHPVNWKLEFGEKANGAGCAGRVWASQHSDRSTTSLFSWSGPSIDRADAETPYLHGLATVRLVEKKLRAMSETRSAPVDTAEEMGRFLEACGIGEVWYVADTQQRTGWLSEVEWSRCSVGQFIAMVRSHLPETIAARKAEAETPGPAAIVA